MANSMHVSACVPIGYVSLEKIKKKMGAKLLMISFNSLHNVRLAINTVFLPNYTL